MSSKVNVTLDSVMEALRTVTDPVTKKDILSQGLVRDLKIESPAVSLKVVVKTPVQTIRQQLESQVKDALTRIAGATQINLVMEVAVPHAHATEDKHGVPGVKHIIAVSSGKGGVGKSTVAVNLACALAKTGFSVGILDSDIYGPNIPTMLGATGAPVGKHDEVRGELIEPLKAHGIKVMSMGFLNRGDEPVVWRGPMLHSVVSQFLLKVDWGNLDYLVVDMPPGTGDVQLSLTQLVPVSGAVVITTPQEVSLQDVRKAILMFEKLNVPVLGIVENMSYFMCDKCETRHHIFGSGGGQNLAEKYHTKLLAQLPLSPAVCDGGDHGTPIVVKDSSSVQGKAFIALADAVHRSVLDLAAKSGTLSGSPEIKITGF